mmetsp:Transcript_124860/g.388686  ORF Transcript_124860/g.388686 Transcript_124860/m.388686 type:complete len:423 (+) Transcript_124860:102-1370(+)
MQAGSEVNIVIPIEVLEHDEVQRCVISQLKSSRAHYLLEHLPDVSSWPAKEVLARGGLAYCREEGQLYIPRVCQAEIAGLVSSVAFSPRVGRAVGGVVSRMKPLQHARNVYDKLTFLALIGHIGNMLGKRLGPSTDCRPLTLVKVDVVEYDPPQRLAVALAAAGDPQHDPGEQRDPRGRRSRSPMVEVVENDRRRLAVAEAPQRDLLGQEAPQSDTREPEEEEGPRGLRPGSPAAEVAGDDLLGPPAPKLPQGDLKLREELAASAAAMQPDLGEQADARASSSVTPPSQDAGPTVRSVIFQGPDGHSETLRVSSLDSPEAIEHCLWSAFRFPADFRIMVRDASGAVVPVGASLLLPAAGASTSGGQCNTFFVEGVCAGGKAASSRGAKGSAAARWQPRSGSSPPPPMPPSPSRLRGPPVGHT